MAFEPAIWTITEPYGLSGWSDSAMGFGSARSDGVYVLSTIYTTRTPTIKYSNTGQQFKGTTVNTSIIESQWDPSVVTLETDASGNKYYVAYATDLTSSPSTWHVWKVKAYGEDVDPRDWSTSDETFLSYKFNGGILEVPGVITTNDNSEATIETVAQDWFVANTGYEVDVDEITNFTGSWLTETDGAEFFNSRTVLGIFGIPYQFMAHVDPRIDYTNAGTSAYLTLHQSIGREFAANIVSNMPILFISPGLPSFLTGVSADDQKSIFDRLADIATGVTTLQTDDMFTKTTKYYTFEYKVPEYYTYCNPACRIAAAYMNITDKQIGGRSTDTVDWQDYTMKTLSGIFSSITDTTSYLSIPFYIESDSQISESFSNDTTESCLTSTVDSISSVGREALFVLGYSNAATGSVLLSNQVDEDAIRETLNSTFDSLVQGNTFFTNLINHLTSVATGGRLIFPKIWSDSGFSRSYDVTIKLRSPDMDNFSIYCNIIAPFIHLLCLTLPREIEDNPNGFYSPFLVRAIYKGFFNVDMGIISSLSVTKGDSGMWNADGIPCAIDVNMTITDLYENISMTATKSGNLSYDTMDNTCFMDYIANLCGVNIYTPEIGRTIRMWFVNNFVNRATDVIDIGLWGNIQNSIGNAITNVWRRSQ